MSQMVEVKTADLIGPALDWAVAQVEGISTHRFREKTYALFGSLAIPLGDAENGYAPSTCWHCGGPLIEKHQMDLRWDGVDGKALWWNATHQELAAHQTDHSPLIAACLALVAAKLGDVVSVPAELVGA